MNISEPERIHTSKSQVIGIDVHLDKVIISENKKTSIFSISNLKNEFNWKFDELILPTKYHASMDKYSNVLKGNTLQLWTGSEKINISKKKLDVEVLQVENYFSQILLVHKNGIMFLDGNLKETSSTKFNKIQRVVVKEFEILILFKDSIQIYSVDEKLELKLTETLKVENFLLLDENLNFFVDKMSNLKNLKSLQHGNLTKTPSLLKSFKNFISIVFHDVLTLWDEEKFILLKEIKFNSKINVSYKLNFN
jgi:hypothetical protein